MQQAVVNVSANPFESCHAERRSVAPGITLNDLAPAEYTGLLICRLNGGPGYVLRTDWGYPVQEGDVVEFFDMPQDGGSLRSLLQIVVTVAAIWVSAHFGAGWGAAVAIGGNLALNVLLPVKPAQQQDSQAASPTYSTSLSGNQARPDAPIPRSCGRMRIVPAFAGQPYVEYDSNGDQYYYAVLVVGYGNHEIESALIDDTPINHFQDILVNTYLPPGTQPSRAKANVVTAPEVSGIEMLSGKYIGGYSASGPGQPATSIGIDMIMPRGLAYQNDDGSMGNLSVSWQVEWREVDDFGSPVTAWAVLATESRTDNQIKARRYSSTYTLPSSKRVEIRTVRTDVKSTSSRASHDLQWAGLRSYLTAPATLNANTAHYEIVMRASEQLSSLSQRSIALITLAQTRTWADGSWGSEIHTRTPSWWMLDIASDPIWGLGLPDARIDFPSFAALAAVSDSRQDRFDYSFDTTMDGWEAIQLIARAARARVFRRNGKLTVARDSLQTLPVTAFTPRNTQPDSMSMKAVLPTRETNDGFIVEYFSNRTWTWLPINCPCPGVSTITKPVRMRLPGITGAKHAEREGKYEAARMLYRRRTVTCTTEMEGQLPAYMSAVRWMPELYGYGQSGDVVNWDAGTLTITLSEPLNFTDSNYLTLMRDDGSLTTPVAVSPGPTAYAAVLPAAPDFTLVLDDGGRERPRFLFGRQTTSDVLVKITAIGDGGKTDDGAQLYTIAAVVDDPRVHAADNALLPSPGEIQDPIVPAVGDGGGGGGDTLHIVSIDDVDSYYHDVRPPDSHTTTYTLSSDGSLGGSAESWLRFNPFETSVTSLYEVRATLLSGTFDTGTFDTWLNLGTDRTWSCTGNLGYWPDATMRIEIRSIADGIVQDSANVRIRIEIEDSGS